MSNDGKQRSSDGGGDSREMDQLNPTTTATTIGALGEEMLLRIFHSLGGDASGSSGGEMGNYPAAVVAPATTSIGALGEEMLLRIFHSLGGDGDDDEGSNEMNIHPAVVEPAATTTTTIGALPEELLLRVFHALPWRDRVRGVEGVCRYWCQLMRTHGWDDVRHFDEQCAPLLKPREQRTTADKDHTMWRDSLLSRIGPRLVSLNLTGGWRKPSEQCRCELLCADLAKCPAVRHLGLSHKCLKPTTIAYIASAYAHKLKSLHIDRCSPSAKDYSRRGEVLFAYISALNRALGTFTALEYLKLIEYRKWLSELRFPASLTSLRHLELSCHMEEGPTCVLSEANVRVLASLPALSSLTLCPAYGSTASYTFLRHFTRLEHISLWLDVSSAGGFVEAMPHLAPRLRALEVRFHGAERPTLLGMMPGSGYTLPHFVSSAIATHLTSLEHLELYFIEEGRKFFDSELLKCLRPLGHYSPPSPLRSLEISFRYLDSPKEEEIAVEEWGWLVGMRNLEYLALDKTPPLAAICAIIEGCKALRYLAPGWGYDPTTEEQALLIAAAATKTYTTSIDGTGGAGYGEKEEEDATLLIPLLVKVATVSTIDSAAGSSKVSRLRFTEEHSFSSPVADRYAFGCLSEGKPPLGWW